MLCKRNTRFVKLFTPTGIAEHKGTIVIAYEDMDGDQQHISAMNWNDVMDIILRLNSQRNHNQRYKHIYMCMQDALSMYESIIDSIDACEPFLAGTELIGLAVQWQGVSLQIRNVSSILGPLATYDLDTDRAMLRAVWEKVRNLFGYYGSLPMTIGSLALVLFQSSMTSDLWTPNNERQIIYEKSAYHGGKTSLYTYGHVDVVEVYDVNSMYPWIMANSEFPVHYQALLTKTYQEGKIGVYRCAFRYHGDAFTYDSEHHLVNESIHAFLTSDEIAEIRRIGGSVDIQDGYVYMRTGIPFSSFFCVLYAEKQYAEGNMKKWLKLLMNALYGKFGQRSEITRYELYNPKKHGITGIQLRGDYVIINEYKKPRHQFYLIAALTTARARIHISRVVREQQTNGASVFYCDTDSVHGAGLDIDESSGMGGWKREFIGEGIYLREKQYALRNGNDERISHKGIAHNPDDPVTYQTLERVLHGKQTLQYRSGINAADIIFKKTERNHGQHHS